jgi:hypothetical protein
MNSPTRIPASRDVIWHISLISYMIISKTPTLMHPNTFYTHVHDSNALFFPLGCLLDAAVSTGFGGSGGAVATAFFTAPFGGEISDFIAGLIDGSGRSIVCGDIEDKSLSVVALVAGCGAGLGVGRFGLTTGTGATTGVDSFLTSTTVGVDPSVGIGAALGIYGNGMGIVIGS